MVQKLVLSFLGLICICLITAYYPVGRINSQKSIDNEDVNKARSVIFAIVENNFLKISNLVTQDISVQQFEQISAQLRTILPTEPLAISPFQKITTSENGVILSRVRFELSLPTKEKRILDLFLRNDSDQMKIYSFRIQGAEELEASLAFSLFSKPFLYYLMLILSLTVQFIVVASLVFCISLRPKFMIFWILLLFFNFYKFDLNWTSGLLQHRAVYGGGFAGSISRMGFEYSSWIISISIPFGALIFWMTNYKTIKMRHSKY